MEICPKDEVDICISRRDDANRLMGPPIIEVEFENNILDPQIIIGEGNIQLKMKKGKPTLCEKNIQLKPKSRIK